MVKLNKKIKAMLSMSIMGEETIIVLKDFHLQIFGLMIIGLLDLCPKLTKKLSQMVLVFTMILLDGV
jgi:hypothetical protein